MAESPKLIQIDENTSPDEREEIENLIREYRDIFRWTYDDPKAYTGDTFQHTIALKRETKSFKQKERHSNPNIGPLI